ncbi:hypothetical protein [methane-oxidizing endosymbiont of Gigantopelta aegis]|uniref:hypothetical protein n=1 Tax=methane-oxidizing endosymbiont of Gigantopelta aegis TaxID=2794938 RepID=UPI0018DBC104|nr:hypothetical protein [methane-oxidizing endosymbiont of Gigantopelta aegis]
MKKIFLRSYLLTAAIGIFFILEGCATAPNARFIKKANDKNAFYATDSRLRLIVNSTPSIFSLPGLVDPKRIVCTEPSPDVATVLANSFGFGINVLGYGNAALTTAQAEGLIQLGERTASIQLLRDKMYQSCLAYQNGAISGTTYSLIMTKLDDTIITLMLGEVAAGAFGRSLGGIGTEANAEASAAMSGLPGELKNIDESGAKIADKNQKIDTLEDEVKALEDEVKALETTTPVEAGRIEAKKATLETKNTELAKTKAERDALLQIIQSTAQTASKSVAKVNKLVTGGSIGQNPGALIAAELSRMQDNFISDASIDQVITSCLVDLGQKPSSEEIITLLFKEKTRQNIEITDEDKDKINKLISQRAKVISAPTMLTKFCTTNLNAIIEKARIDNQAYRIKKVKTAQISDAIKLKIAETRGCCRFENPP